MKPSTAAIGIGIILVIGLTYVMFTPESPDTRPYSASDDSIHKSLPISESKEVDSSLIIHPLEIKAMTFYRDTINVPSVDPQHRTDRIMVLSEAFNMIANEYVKVFDQWSVAYAKGDLKEMVRYDNQMTSILERQKKIGLQLKSAVINHIVR